jgi:hypothetical protein
VKTNLLLNLMALAGGVSTVTAQSNPVAYFSIPIPAYQRVMIANPLNTTNNTITNLFRNASDGATFDKWYDDFSGYRAYTYDAILEGWLPNGDITLNPGEGGFYYSLTPTTVTFVGEILQGRLTNTLPIGRFVIRSSMVPQAGTPTDLGIPAEGGDILELFQGSYSAYVYDVSVPGWVPSEPTIGVGEPFWYRKAPTATTNLWIVESRPYIRIGDPGPGTKGGNFGFSVSGTPLLVFVIQASTNLLDWVSLVTNTLSTGYYQYTDPTAPTFPARFYRVREP